MEEELKEILRLVNTELARSRHRNAHASIIGKAVWIFDMEDAEQPMIIVPFQTPEGYGIAIRSERKHTPITFTDEPAFGIGFYAIP